MKEELKKVKIDLIEKFKSRIEELIEKDESWKKYLDDLHVEVFIFRVMDLASIYFMSEEIPYSVVYNELYDFCFKKRREHWRKEGIDII